jgi:uncharacterized membrane protein
MPQTSQTPLVQYRQQSIDIVRGLVMVIMALDHVREYFSYTAYRPTDVTQASALLFFTRWITHLCAPTFVFLSGVSIFLYVQKVGSLKKASAFLVTRGLWLIVLEVFVISFILTQGYQLTVLEVIWAIACSMILMAALIWLPRWLQTVISLLMIVGHDALPSIGFLHSPPFFIGSPPVLVAYTIVPWVGVMLLGYVTGTWFTGSQQSKNNKLLTAGTIAIALFIILRALNLYGDPFPWTVQERGGVYTFLSFLNVSKSPPSLLFLAVTLGLALMALAVVNRLSTPIKQFLMVYGKVPFFFFIVHLALISLSSYTWSWRAFGKGINLSFTSPKDWPADYSPSLLRAYFVWLLIVLALYYPCRWYGRYKSTSGKWWTSYL